MEINVDWYYDRMKLVKIFAKEVEVEEVAICIPLEYKTAVLIYELSKYTNVIATDFDGIAVKEKAVEWLRDRGIDVVNRKKAINAKYFLDCAAVLSRTALKHRRSISVVELTKTGEEILKRFEGVKAISVDSSTLKGIGENTYGTAFGLLDALMRLNVYLPGKDVVVIGFGRVGRGCARLLKALGCKVKVFDISESKMLEALYEGFEIADSFDADIVVTCTGVRGVLKIKDSSIRDGAILLNLGAEMEIEPAGELVADYNGVKKYRYNEIEYYLVADGYAANLAIANGTPIEVMDRTFSASILALNYLREDFNGVIPLPREIEKRILITMIAHRL